MNNYKDLNDYEVMYMIGEVSDDATNLLFNKYKPVIRKIAKEYYQYGKDLKLELEDFIQEGYLGLNTAIRNYVDSKDCLFYTYANICIRTRMGNLLRSNSNNKNFVLNNSISLNNPVYDDVELIECLNDPNAVLPDNELSKKILIDKFRSFLYGLNIERASILELKYNGFTHKEIAMLLDIHLKTVSHALFFIKKKLVLYR